MELLPSTSGVSSSAVEVVRLVTGSHLLVSTTPLGNSTREVGLSSSTGLELLEPLADVVSDSEVSAFVFLSRSAPLLDTSFLEFCLFNLELDNCAGKLSD